MPAPRTSSLSHVLLWPLIAVIVLLTSCGGGSSVPEDITPASDVIAEDAASGDVVEDVAAVFDPTDWDHGESVVWAPESIPEDADVFPLGVQAGGVEPGSVTLWTRALASDPVALRVFREGDRDGAVVLVHESRAEGDANGLIHARVEGLAPGTWYRYVFLVPSDGDGAFPARSAIGQFRTAFAPGDRQPLVISATHGTNWREQPWVTLERAATFPTDLFIHLGDIGYMDDAETLPEYRAMWWRLLDDPGFRAILSHTGYIPVWDDHEVENNYDPEREDPERFAAANEAFFENTPVPLVEGAPRRHWRSHRWGDTAEIFELDCRSERRPSTIGTPEATYISREQMDWLKAGLLASTATFKIILSSVPISDLPSDWWAAMREDSWHAYEAQRDDLLTTITDNGVENVYFLTGDIHVGAVTRVEATGPRSHIYEIVCGPGGTRGNVLPEAVESGYFPEEDVFPSELFLFWSGRMAVTLLTLDPTTEPPSVGVRFIDGVTGDVNLDIHLPE